MATIIVINGRHQGEWYSIGDQPMVFGRDDTLLAEIIDPRVSRRHVAVRQAAPGRFEAVDLDSHNGTKVNGDRIGSGEAGAYPLAEDDVIQIGHTLLAFTLGDFDDDEQIEPFVEQARHRQSFTLEHLGEREKYTEAAALFSRLFKRK